MILARAYFGWDTGQFGLAFDVACHVGTLLAILVYFRRELQTMAASVPGMLARPMPEPARQIWLIAAGTMPIVIAGLLFSDVVESTMRTPQVAGVTLALGALAMMAAERLGARNRSEASLTVPEALGLGCAQAAAIVPGVSRSGVTIALAILLGLRRDSAARFSFLLGIPAILAAAGHAGLDVAKLGMGSGTTMLFAAGMLSSATVGYVTVKYFIRYLAGHSIDAFAWYRLALAASVMVWLMRHP